MATYSQDIMTLNIPDTVNYILIAFMLLSIIIIVICIIFFAKWLTMGPKLKAKWRKIIGKASGDKGLDGVKIKGKLVVIQDGYVEEIREKIKNAQTPQELLEYQIQLENHNKQKNISETEIKVKENEKLEKVEAKAESKILKAEAKIESTKLKSEEKVKKQEIKTKKIEDKDSEKKKEGK